MTATWEDWLSSNKRGLKIAYAVVIEGIPYCFTSRPLTEASVQAFSWCTTSRGVYPLLGVPDQGETRLDLEKRRMVDATLDLELVDDEDGTLQALFALNARRAAWVADDYDNNDTTITINDAAPFSNGDFVYVGAETIKIGTISGDDLTGCTRGALGSIAQKRRGTVDDGEEVFALPPTWVGRRVALYGILIDATGHISEGTTSLLWTFRIDKTPENTGSNTWSIRCGGVCDDFAKRPIYVGKKQVQLDSAGNDGARFRYDASSSSYYFELEDTLQFAASATSVQSILLEMRPAGNAQNFWAVGRITDVDHVLKRVYFTWSQSYIAPALFSDDARVVSVRQFFMLVGSTGEALLDVLASDLGDGDNDATYDVLPGYDSGTFDRVYWRLGAGIPGSRIDQDAFKASTSHPFSYTVDMQTAVADLLGEYCLFADAWWGSNSEGQLTLGSLAPTRPSSPRTITNIITKDGPPTVRFDESGVYPFMALSTNWSPFDQEYRSTLNLVDYGLLAKYPQRQDVRKVSLKGLQCRDIAEIGPQRWIAAENYSIADIESWSHRIMRSEGIGRVFVSFTMQFDGELHQVGDLVLLDNPSFDALPNFEGGQGFSNRYARIVSKRPNRTAGTFSFEVHVLERLLFVASSAVIASASGDTLTLRTTGPEVRTTSPQNDFAVGDFVLVVDKSSLATAPAIDSLEIIAILSGPPRLQLSSPPSFAVQNNIDYVVVDPTTLALVPAASASGYLASEQAYLETTRVPEDSGNPQRWR